VARAWLKVEGALGRHPKVRALAERYGVHPYLIVGFLVAWWDYCADFGSGERPANCSRTVLAEFAQPIMAAAREAVVPDIADALREVRLMDAHGHPKDWQDYTGALLTKRAKDAERMRTVREQSKDGRVLEKSRVEESRGEGEGVSASKASRPSAKQKPLRSRASEKATAAAPPDPGWNLPSASREMPGKDRPPKSNARATPMRDAIAQYAPELLRVPA